MAIITPPYPLPLRGAKWRVRDPSQVNRSAWTGRRKVVGLPGAAYWTVSGDLRVFIGEASASAWRAFFLALRGVRNTFRLQATERTQISVPIAGSIYGDTAAAASTVEILGTPGLPQLPAGTLIGVGLRVYTLSADTVYGSGSDIRVASITPALVAAAPHGTPVSYSPASVYASVAAGATTLILRGPAGERQLLAGEMLTINDQLVCLIADSTPAGASELRSVTFEPELREPATAAAIVERSNPYALVALVSGINGWDVSAGQIYSFSIDAEEAL